MFQNTRCFLYNPELMIYKMYSTYEQYCKYRRFIRANSRSVYIMNLDRPITFSITYIDKHISRTRRRSFSLARRPYETVTLELPI